MRPRKVFRKRPHHSSHVLPLQWKLRFTLPEQALPIEHNAEVLPRSVGVNDLGSGLYSNG